MKIYFPMIALMTMYSKMRKPRLYDSRMDSIICLMRIWRPVALRISLKILMTLNALNIYIPESPDVKNSSKLEIMTTKSKILRPDRIYSKKPRPVIFTMHSNM